ncbi:MAG: RING finger domain-containing protein [Candidatus Thorarchaeota archaeon]
MGSRNYTKSSGSLLCVICRIKVKEPEEYYQCSYCLSTFHTNHLTEWLKIKKECPVCKRKFL